VVCVCVGGCVFVWGCVYLCVCVCVCVWVGGCTLHDISAIFLVFCNKKQVFEMLRAMRHRDKNMAFVMRQRGSRIRLGLLAPCERKWAALWRSEQGQIRRQMATANEGSRNIHGHGETKQLLPRPTRGLSTGLRKTARH